MQSEDYRETLEDALKNLVEVNRKIYDSIIPIAMAGEPFRPVSYNIYLCPILRTPTNLKPIDIT